MPRAAVGSSRGVLDGPGGRRRQVQALEDEGLVSRTAGADDGRVIAVRLTDPAATLQRIVAVRTTHMTKVLADRPSDRVALASLVSRLVDDLKSFPSVPRQGSSSLLPTHPPAHRLRGLGPRRAGDRRRRRRPAGRAHRAAHRQERQGDGAAVADLRQAPRRDVQLRLVRPLPGHRGARPRAGRRGRHRRGDLLHRHRADGPGGLVPVFVDVTPTPTRSTSTASRR